MATWRTTQTQLREYYKSYFPFQVLTNWLLDDHNRHKLSHREFSWSIIKPDDQEIYKRYVSVQSWEELKAIITNNNIAPHKFDIGAEYDKPVSVAGDVLGNTLIPQRHDFVIDIDMNDYDDVRTCCTGKTVCSKCWRFPAIAAKILHRALREDFGFDRITLVFSGRRGLHIWCGAMGARDLSADLRHAVATYLTLIRDPLALRGTASTWLQGRYESQSLEIMEQEWSRVLQEQDIFFHEEKGPSNSVVLWNIITRYYDDKSYSITNLKEDLQLSGSMKNSWGLWRGLDKQSQVRPSLKIALNVALCHFLQPRLDLAVSKDRKHLLKAPFCIHQGTGKVCCPLRLHEIDSFNPEDVVTLSDLVAGNPDAVSQFEEYVSIMNESCA